MKSLGKMIMAAGAFVAIAVSCDNNEIKIITPPDVADLTGVEASYERGLHEYLEIAPSVEFIGYTEENKDSVKYEWSINYQTVSTDSVLTYKCDALGTFNGYLKVETSTGAKIADFSLVVASPYDKGLLLLSSTSEGSMLTWKRLDKMETPASPYAFKDNNPTLELGKTPLALCWHGNALTNLVSKTNTKVQYKDADLEILLTTGDPVKMYALDSKTLQVRNELQFDGSGNFSPSAILVPYGFQNVMWNNSTYFIGNGKEWGLSDERSFIASEDLTDDLSVSDICCSMITDNSDMLKVYYDMNSRTLQYVSGLMGNQSGAKVFNINTPMYISGSDGIYREASSNCRYEATKLIFVGNDGSNVYVYSIMPSDFAMDETIEKEISGNGHITPESAVAVNPIQPVLYYSNKNEISRLNYDGENFDSQAYITLDGNYVVKQMAFNNYDAGKIFIAAENLDENGEMKASLFIYDISDKTAAKLLFKEDRVGGSVRSLIYKGNGYEWEDNAAEAGASSLSRLFRRK